MDKDIFSGKIGEVGSYDVAFVGGKLQVTSNVAVGAFLANAMVAIDANKVVDAIEAAIPGKLDDAVLEVLRKLLIGT